MRIYERLSEVYDLGWRRFPEQYVSLISGLLAEQGLTQAKILDLACGTGTLAIALAGQGHIVRGIDISPAMVSVAKAKAGNTPNISFETQDMTRFSVPGKFDLVTCTFDALNYVRDITDLKKTFARVHASLKQTGLFVFDSTTHQHYLKAGSSAQKQELGGLSFTQKWSYDKSGREASTTFEFNDGSQEIHRQRPYDLAQLGPMLIDSGFLVFHAWSGFDRNPYDARSARLFCVAVKK